MPVTWSTQCPFDQPTCEMVNKLLADCNDTQCILERLRSMGFAVEELASDNNSMMQFARNFTSNFNVVPQNTSV